jgi:division protein CdvB (Snf7/Vps24/ESCRT-III family)
LGTIRSLRLLGGNRDGANKSKIVTVLKEIEIQRRELENLRGRLSERRQKLFASTVRAIQEKNKSKVNVYASEYAEVIKTAKVVEASELALVQVTLRLQSIMEIGDAMAHMTSAFKSLKSVSKTMEDFVPTLDAASESISSTLAETMSHMGNISPGISVDVHNENVEELVEQARKFAEERAENLKQSLHIVPSAFEAEVSGVEDRVPVLATGDDFDEEDESPVLGTIFANRPDSKVESQVLKYAAEHNGVIDVSETSINLGIPQPEVELSTIRLVAQGKVKSRSDT